MRSRYLHLLLPVILIAFGCCSKPSHIDTTTSVEVPAYVSEVSIRDTLPERFVSTLGLEKSTGLQFRADRDIRTYFRYEADSAKLLEALSQLGFSRNAHVADTLCRPLTAGQFDQMRRATSEYEQTEAGFFWDVDPRNFEIYECIKTPARHLVLIRRGSGDVMHLVAG